MNKSKFIKKIMCSLLFICAFVSCSKKSNVLGGNIENRSISSVEVKIERLYADKIPLNGTPLVATEKNADYFCIASKYDKAQSFETSSFADICAGQGKTIHFAEEVSLSGKTQDYMKLTSCDSDVDAGKVFLKSVTCEKGIYTFYKPQ